MTTTFKVDSIGSIITANATAFEQEMLAVAGYAMTDNGQSAQLLRLRAKQPA